MTSRGGADKPLEGRVALVTGASSGIGHAISVAVAAAGATLVAVGRDAQRVEMTVQEAATYNPQAEGAVCDLTRDVDVRSLADRIASRHGALHILVHSAGTIEFGAIEDAPIGQLDRMVATNLRAPILLTQAMLPLLRETRGHVVFLNSSAGVRPSAGAAAYGATKHALRGVAEALREEINPFGIRVTSMYPGRTRTPMQASVHRWEQRGEPGSLLLEPADIASIVVAVLALPPTAEVTDVHIRPTRRSG